jgi:NAD(P)-dependent dehydrogenase (short-subunit alcohol dehydrogenase family)
MNRFSQKVVLVTGSGSGIGRGIALRFANEKASVFVIDIQRDFADNVAREIQATGGTCVAINADVTQLETIKTTIQRAQEMFGRIDVLVNNVGHSKVQPLMVTDDEAWEAAMKVNVKAAFSWSRAVAEGMIERKSGCIINIASDLAKAADQYSGAYIAAKHAVLGITKTFALELAPYGIRVNAVCPGIVKTGLLESFVQQLASVTRKTAAEIYEDFVSSVPLKRLASPEDVAGVVAFLASNDASYMTGQAVNVTGGLLIY